MRRPFGLQVCRWLLPGMLVLAAAPSWGQRILEEEPPRWLRLQFPETSLGMDVEALEEDQTSNGTTSTHKNLLLVPLVGFRAQGSIYHPNLLTFDFNGQGGLGWADDIVTSTGYSQTLHESQNLLMYVATVNLLSAKPYNASFFASQDHTYNNYDFFNTITVDSTRYGGRLAWTTKNFNLSTDQGYRDQIASGLTGVTETQETYLNFNGINQRKYGSSTLTYSYDEFNNTLNYGPVQSSLAQSIGASDTETLGYRDQITATTGASYGWAEYSSLSAETFNATENVNVNFRPNLNGFLNLSFDDSRLEPASSSLFQGIAGVRHQLYESLTSTLDLHGNYGEVSSSGSSGVNDRYGVGLAEAYTKRLGSWGRLSLGGAAIVDHYDIESLGGNTVTVINEPHVLTDTTPVFLNNPLVVQSTIFVTGPSGVPTYVNGVDYQVFQTGELTQIQRVPTSVSLPNGGSVLVSYQSQSPATSSYDSLNGSAQVRLDLFNTFGVYARINSVENNAPPAALAETLYDLVAGVDVTWRWLRAGAEYEDYDSDFTQYRASRLFQNFTFPLGENSNLGLNFNQIWYRYANNQNQTQYQFRCLFNTQISSWLFWNVEGGYYMQDALGLQQNLAAARTGLNFNWGQLSIRTGYQYNYQLTQQTESRNRNFFYFYLKRSF